MESWEQIAFCLGLFASLLALYALPESKTQRERQLQIARTQRRDWRDDAERRDFDA